MAVFDRAWRIQHSAELIVSDGGSTDGTLEIAARHADVVVRHDEERRQTIAEGRNNGASRAQGNVLVFINGDTVPKDIETFSRCIDDFAQRTGRYAKASALACPVSFDPSEQELRDRVFHVVYNSYVRLLSWLRVGAGRGECQVVRKEMFDRVRGYREELVAGEDFDLFARIGLRGRVLFAQELHVIESPRRFRKFGYLRVLGSWTINALSVMFTGRSSSDEWEPVR